jgi:hypothetical protein
MDHRVSKPVSQRLTRSCIGSGDERGVASGDQSLGNRDDLDG